MRTFIFILPVGSRMAVGKQLERFILSYSDRGLTAATYLPSKHFTGKLNEVMKPCSSMLFSQIESGWHALMSQKLGGKRSVPWGTTEQTRISNQHNHPEITKGSRIPSRNKEDEEKAINFLKKRKAFANNSFNFCFH